MSQEEVTEEFPIEQHTGIAAISWPGERRLFVQGIDATIRQISQKDDQSWKGGKVEDAIATGKFCTPIAATVCQTDEGQPNVRVYFLDEDNYIRERSWNPMSEWVDGALSSQRFRAASFSQLALTSWNEGNIILYYQSEDGTIQSLHGWVREERWKPGSSLRGASVGCSLSAVNMEFFNDRWVRLYYESEHSEIVEACCTIYHDEDRTEAGHYSGHFRSHTSVGSSVSGISFTDRGIEIWLYVSGTNGLLQHWYGDGWADQQTRFEGLTPETQIAALRTSSTSANIYFVQGDGLVEVQHNPDRITHMRILKISRPSEPSHAVYSSTETNTDEPSRAAFTTSSYMTPRSRESSNNTDPAEYGTIHGSTAKDALGDGTIREDPDPQDTASIYSGASEVPKGMIDRYVSEFVDIVLGALQDTKFTRDSLHQGRVNEVLPDLLKDFAIRFGHDAKSKERQKIVFFTRKHRKIIATHLASQWRLNKQDSALLETRRERAGDWVESQAVAGERPEIQEIPDDSTGTLNPEDPLAPFDSVSMDSVSFDESDDETAGVSGDKANHDPSEYMKLILESQAYQWLLAALRREVALDFKGSPSMLAIRKEIASSLPSSPRINVKSPVQAFNLTFHIPWDPAQFVKDQDYREKPEDALYSAITLTGEAKNAQALTTAQYLLQTWPTTGQHILQLIQAIVARGTEGEVPCSLPDGTALRAWMDLSEKEHPQFLVEASGTSSALEEVGQQLAWISAALQSSPFDSVTFCNARIARFREQTSEVPGAIRRYDCDIEYAFRSVEEDFTPVDGECWFNLFRNPVVVEGFPILLRAERDTGLEIPLSIMAALADTKRVDALNDKLFIKGFSTMLYPTKRTNEDFVIWHVRCKENGERISYLEADEIDNSVPISVLSKARHIVGWCFEAELIAGSLRANYDVERSQLPGPTSKFVLQSFSISAGKIVTVSFNIAVGVKDKPISTSRKGYKQRLRWIDKQFAVFWDEKCRRGWLVNGSTALLHLVRASWKATETEPFGRTLKTASTALKDAEEAYTTESALDVLINDENMELEIYLDAFEPDGKTRQVIRFQDQVEEMYSKVEKMIDHQRDTASRPGWTLNTRVRNHIDGWEFNDVISEIGCNPAFATLQNLGKGWVHLVKDIGAIVFLGQGFGEMIKPTSECCTHWAQLPTDSYYLGVCVSDIIRIIKLHGDQDCTEPRKLSKNVSWPNSEDRFRPCECGSNRDHSDLSQVLQQWRKSMKLLGNKELTANGAVILHHSIDLTGLSFSRIFNRDRKVVNASHDLQRKHDSGVGSSQSQSQSLAQSSAGGHLHSGQPSWEAAPLEPSPSSGMMSGRTQATDSDEDTIHHPEKGVAQGVVTEGEVTAVELGQDSTAQSRELMADGEIVGHDVRDTPWKTSGGEAEGGEVEGGKDERQSWQESLKDDEMVQENSDASRSANDRADLSQNMGR